MFPEPALETASTNRGPSDVCDSFPQLAQNEQLAADHSEKHYCLDHISSLYETEICTKRCCFCFLFLWSELGNRVMIVFSLCWLHPKKLIPLFVVYIFFQLEFRVGRQHDHS